MKTINGEWIPKDWELVSVDGRPFVRRAGELLTPAEAIALRDLLCTSSRKLKELPRT